MRAFLLRDLLSSGDLRSLIGRLRSLPSVPALYAELSDELSSEDASLRRVGQIIGKDVAMTAKILQIANSAYFGVPTRVVSAEQAVRLMGVNLVRTTLLSNGLVSLLDGAATRRFRLSGISRRAYAVTGFVRLMALREGLDANATAHAVTAAMLHDAGRLVLASCLPDEYGEIVDRAETERRSLVDVEHDEFGCTHAEVGAYLLGLWGLSDEVTTAVAWHHRPSASTAKALDPLALLHAADGIASELLPDSDHAVAPPVDSDFLSSLGVADRYATWRSACMRMVTAN